MKRLLGTALRHVARALLWVSDWINNRATRLLTLAWRMRGYE